MRAAKLFILVVVVAGVRWIWGKRHRGLGRTKSALDTLKQRYARGEITKEEFDRIKDDIA